ncbi:hypothetical protein [Dyella solisilvae]|uniref:hypothetical protein n=1 Tax=Dyella solisilvae TaxID=1920168 RepID=UPI0011C07199|nr:hypothetical protein [Dyella solisilvae]
MNKRTWFYLGCLLAAGNATAQTAPQLVPVGVISTERLPQYSSNVDPTFAAYQRRLAAAYDQAIADAAEHFLSDVRVPAGQRCDVSLVILPSGLVVRVEPGQCTFAPATLKAISDALVEKSLPYRGYESVFQRNAHLAFCSPKGSCSEASIKAN